MTFSLCFYFTWYREDNPFHPLSNYFSLNLLTSGLHPFSSDHVKVTNSRSKSYTLFKPKNYWERRYRCREHTKNVIILRVKDEAYLIICIRLQTFREQVTLPTRASIHNLCRKGTDTYDIPLNATYVRIKFRISLPCNL